MPRSVNISTIAFNMRVNDSALNRGLAQSSRRINRFAKDGQQTLGFLTNASAIAATAFVGAFALGTREALQFGDQLAKQARNIDISGQALLEYGTGFEFAGSTQAVFVKGVQQSTRSVLEASQGLTTYTRALDVLNLRVEDLIGLAPEEQFRRIVEAAQELEDPATRIAVLQQILGRAGKELGSVDFEQIDLLRERLSRLGATLSDQQLANIERFNDNITLTGIVLRTRFTAAIGDALGRVGDFDGLILRLTDGVETVSRGFIDLVFWVSNNTEAISKLAIGVGVLVAGWFAFKALGVAALLAQTGIAAIALAVNLGPVALTMGAIGVAALSVAASAILVIENWDKVPESISRILNLALSYFGLFRSQVDIIFTQLTFFAISQIEKIGNFIANTLGRLPGGIGQPFRSFDNVTGDAVEVLEINLRQLREERDEFIREIGRTSVSILTEDYRGPREIIDGWAEGLRNATAELFGFNTAFNAVGSNFRSREDLITGLLGPNSGLDPISATGRAAATGRQEIGKQIAGAVQSSITRGLETADFSDAADALTDNLRRTFARNLAEQFGNFLAGQLQRLPGGLGSFFGSFFPDRHTGGEIHRSGLYNLQRGEIVVNPALGQSAGNNIVINLNVPDHRGDIKQALNEELPGITSAVTRSLGMAGTV